MADTSTPRPSRKAKRLDMTPRTTPVWAKKPKILTPLSAGPTLRRLSATPRGFSLSRVYAESRTRPSASLAASEHETTVEKERERVPPSREQLRQCQVLTQGKWCLHSVSPLYNLQAMVDRVRSYSRSLTAHIKVGIERWNGVATAREAEETGAEDGGRQTVMRASISLLKELKSFVNDHPAISLAVYGRTSTGKEIVLCQCILCGCGATGEDEIGKFVMLPLLLCNGTSVATSHLVDWLQMTFDCRVSRLEIPSRHLFYLIANWTRYASDKGKGVDFCFSPSRHVVDKGLRQIVLSVRQDTAKALLASIHSNMRSELTDDEAERFRMAVSAHFYRVFRIRVEALNLTGVTSPIARVSSDGNLTILSGDHAVEILEFLTGIIWKLGDRR